MSNNDRTAEYFSIKDHVEQLRSGASDKISPVILLPEAGGMNNWQTILDALPDLPSPPPDELPEFHFNLKLGDGDEISAFKVKAQKREEQLQEMLNEGSEPADNIDDATAADLAPIIEQVQAVEDAELSASVATISKAKLNCLRKDIKFFWEAKDVQGKTFLAIDACKGLTDPQKANFKTGLQEIHASAHRTPTAAQKEAYTALQRQLVAKLSAIAKAAGKEFRGVVYPEDSWASLISVSSNWCTFEGLCEVNGLSREELSAIEAKSPQTFIDSLAAYCVDTSMTTTVNAKRGLTKESAVAVEFRDNFPAYGPASSTGTNPMACGEGWQTAYMDHMEDVLKLSLDAGRSLEILESGSAFSLLQRLASRNSKKLHCQVITLAMPLANPSRYKAPLTLFLYTKLEDAKQLRNFSIVVKEYAPVFQRHESMSTSQRIESCTALQFFMGWIPEGTFSEPFTEPQARKSLDFTIFFPTTNGNRMIKDISRFGLIEREEKIDLSDSNYLIEHIVRTTDTSILPSDLKLAHDTRLQRVLEVWKLRCAATVKARTQVEKRAQQLQEYLALYSDKLDRTSKALEQYNPDLAASVLPYTTSRAFTALRALDADISDVELLLELACRSDAARQLLEDKEQYAELWGKGAKQQTADSVAAAKRVIRYYARHGSRKIKQGGDFGKEALYMIRKAERTAEVNKEWNQMPKAKARKKARDQMPKAKAQQKERDQKPKAKARRKERDQMPEVKARRKEKMQSPGHVARSNRRMLCLDCLHSYSALNLSHHRKRCPHKAHQRGYWEIGTGYSEVRGRKKGFLNGVGEQDEHVALADLEAFFDGFSQDKRLYTPGHALKIASGQTKRPVEKPYVNPPTFREERPIVVSAEHVMRRWEAIEGKLVHLFGEEAAVADNVEDANEAEEQS